VEAPIHSLQQKEIQTPSLAIFLFDTSEPNGTSKPRYLSMLSVEEAFSQPIDPVTHFSLTVKKLCVSTSGNAAPSNYPTSHTSLPQIILFLAKAFREHRVCLRKQCLIRVLADAR